MYLVMGITGKVGGATARHLLKQGKQVIDSTDELAHDNTPVQTSQPKKKRGRPPKSAQKQLEDAMEIDGPEPEAERRLAIADAGLQRLRGFRRAREIRGQGFQALQIRAQ